MRILFVQTGDYAEAFWRLKEGGAETYRDQRASVEWVERLSGEHSVTVLAISAGTPHDTLLSPTLRSVHVNYGTAEVSWLSRFLDEVRPDRLICRTPHHIVLGLAKRRSILTLANFADYFSNGSPKQLYRNLRLRLALTSSFIPCVSNHNRNASRSVASALFYPKSRIVPWDRYLIDSGQTPKTGLTNRSTPTVFYAGVLEEKKGVGDLLDAISLLRQQGIHAMLTLAGSGNEGRWKARANELGIGNIVHFLGRVPHADVMKQMRMHDTIVVPSRWEYPEGLPNTLSEALASRTPLVISDHPAFSGRFVGDRDCLDFSAGNPVDLARTLQRLFLDEALYSRLSETSEAALQSLRFGLYWDRLWTFFIEDPLSKTGWVKNNSLAALQR